MTEWISQERIEKALARAAHTVKHGTPDEKAGIATVLVTMIKNGKLVQVRPLNLNERIRPQDIPG